MGLLRAGVGIALLAAPRRITRNDDASFVLLIRTIGVRDLVLGAGAALSNRDHGDDRWGHAALASDALDVVIGSASIPSVGVGGGLVAALTPAPFVAGDLWALRGSSR